MINPFYSETLYMDKNVNKIVNKKEKKDRDCECVICGCKDRTLLDLHRIVEGKKGGEYTEHNTVCVCVTCHRFIGENRIKILGKYFCSSGKFVLNYIDITGKENLKEI